MESLLLASTKCHDPPQTSGITTEEHCTDTDASSLHNEVHATTSAIFSSHSAVSTASPVARPTTTRRHNHAHDPVTTSHYFPLSEHFNAPVRPHVWYSKRRSWTRAQLDRERREFFETRVTGRPEIWAALSAAISLVRDERDLATAQSIIDAAGVTVPTGDLCQGCYDEQGALYRLPQCIVSDPENTIQVDGTDDYFDEDDDDDDYDDDDDGLFAGKSAADGGASGDELISQDRERRRDEKGKTSERDLISVKARLSDRGGLDLVLSVGKSQNVGFLARKIQQEADVGRNQTVKIAYLGKLLRGHSSLLDQGWQPGQVVNAFIITRPSCS